MISVEIFVGEDVDEALPFEMERLQKYAVAVLKDRAVKLCDINIVFVDDMTMAGMNESYKGREGATDVLSFLLSEENEPLAGEIYISLERAKAQAAEYGAAYEEEIVRLATHGLLHLAGMVHDTDEAYEAMTAMTETYVGSFFGGER